MPEDCTFRRRLVDNMESQCFQLIMTWKRRGLSGNAPSAGPEVLPPGVTLPGRGLLTPCRPRGIGGDSIVVTGDESPAARPSPYGTYGSWMRKRLDMGKLGGRSRALDSVDSEPPEPSVECLPAHTQDLGDPALVAVGLGEGGEDGRPIVAVRDGG